MFNPLFLAPILILQVVRANYYFIIHILFLSDKVNSCLCVYHINYYVFLRLNHYITLSFGNFITLLNVTTFILFNTYKFCDHL